MKYEIPNIQPLLACRIGNEYNLAIEYENFDYWYKQFSIKNNWKILFKSDKEKTYDLIQKTNGWKLRIAVMENWKFVFEVYSYQKGLEYMNNSIPDL